MKSVMLFAFVIVLFGGGATASAVERTLREALEFNFDSVTGLTSRPSDLDSIKKSVMTEMGDLDEDKLFGILFAKPQFINNRISLFISKMSNEESEPYEDVDDF